MMIDENRLVWLKNACLDAFCLGSLIIRKKY